MYRHYGMCNVIRQAHKRSDSERRQVSVLNLVIFAAVISYYVQNRGKRHYYAPPCRGGGISEQRDPSVRLSHGAAA